MKGEKDLVESLTELFQGLKEVKIRKIFEMFMSQRDNRIDLVDQFDISSINEIATRPDQISDQTKIWCGPIAVNDKDGNLLPEYHNLFKKLPKEIRIFISPKEEVKVVKVRSGGKSKDQLLKEMKEKGIDVSDDARDAMEFDGFQINEEEILIANHLKVKHLSLGSNTTRNIWKRTEELGLKDCPSDFGPNYRMQYLDQSSHEWLKVKMKQIIASRGVSIIFGLACSNGVPELLVSWVGLDEEWYSGSTFVVLSP